MGVVGSLPSSAPLPSSPPPPSSSPLPSSENDTTEISHQELLSPKDECTSYTMINEEDLNRNSSPSIDIKDDNDSNQSYCQNKFERKSPVVVSYGPLSVKVRQVESLTLATGRRSKFMKLEGDAALRREIRRKRNRDAAKKLKERRIYIEEKLTNEINELEHKEQDLLSVIKSLETYKEELEAQHKTIISLQDKLSQATSSTLKYIEHNQQLLPQQESTDQDDINIKNEPRSPSSQWQLMFSI